MKFLVDAQLPRRLADWLTQQGHDALHTLDLPRANRTSDTEVIGRADTDGRAVVTKDADFVNSFQIQGLPHKLLLVSTGNISNNELVRLWEKHLPAIVRAAEGSRFVEVTADAVVIHA